MKFPTDAVAPLSGTHPFGVVGSISWQRRWFGTWPYWSCQLVGWGFLVVWEVVFTWLLGSQFDTNAIQVALAVSVIGVAVTHLLRVLLLMLRAQWTGWRLAAGVTCLIPMAAFAKTGPCFAIRIGRVMASPKPPLVDKYYLYIFISQVPLIVAWTALYFAFIYYRDYRKSLIEQLRLEAEVKEAELRVLKAQINPHFLFNNLNSIWAMIPRELTQPRESLMLLADLLRAALTLGEKKTVSFRQEWETVQIYLTLEQSRFEQRLRVQHAIDPATAEWPVPPFILQTLVENAVKFGIRPRDEGGEIRIEAYVGGETVHFRVTNPGRIATATTSTGVGLKNSRARLQHLFGDAAALTLTQATEDSVIAEVTIRKI